MDINDLTYQINGAVYEVNKVLGQGFLEKVYENSLLLELHIRGLNPSTLTPSNQSIHSSIKYKNTALIDLV